MKRVITLFAVLLMGWSVNAWSFACKTANGTLQQHTTAIIRFAVHSGLIDYNPAQEIAGAVATAKRQHRAALELNRIPELLQRIYHYSGRPLTRLAVELTLLVFIRSSELRFCSLVRS
ncbi:hypothetical protein RJ644_19835 [Escherichia coli]|nr:hypothetical protein [Escherichia coli]WNE08773.1 hypothetical protein RJ644_19835 [Escherichia coli]